MSPAYGIKIRQLFSNLFLEYVQKNHGKIKTFIKVATEIKKIADGSVTESEVIRRLKERAKFAAKKKISEAQTFAESSSEELIFRIPDSSSSVAIRY